MPQVYKETNGVATAVALGILQLRTNLSAALAEPDESHRGKLPVDAGARRCRCRIVRLCGRHVTGRAANRFSPDAALSAVDIHAMHPRLGFARRRPYRDCLGVDVAVGAAWMRHDGFNPLPCLQPLGPADAARRQRILDDLVLGRDDLSAAAPTARSKVSADVWASRGSVQVWCCSAADWLAGSYWIVIS
jgi:hypothetical protein